MIEFQWGVRAHLRRHALLAAATAFLGAMLGVERTVVPLIAQRDFAVASVAVTLSFIASFGALKAVANLLAGRLADRFGRRRLLIAGWLIGLPVPLVVAFAPTWSWIVAANLLLGASQGLVWTMTLTMMSDLAGPRRRGSVIGWNELAGYVGMAVTAFAAGALALSMGLRPVPMVLSLAAGVLGLVLSLGASETILIVRSESSQAAEGRRWSRSAMVACCQAGLVTKVNDAGAWGLLPLLLSDHGYNTKEIGAVVAMYPLLWGLLQGVTGPLADRVGRRGLLVVGMLVQAGALALLLLELSLTTAVAAAVLLGLGTALAYPTLLASAADLAVPGGRASALGLYRFWRDLGLVVGALGLGALADRAGSRTAVGVAVVASVAAAMAAGRWLRQLPGDSEGAATRSVRTGKGISIPSLR